jgi:hypothetical protein
LDTYFKDELSSGKVTYETFNLEDKKNARIVKKYNAYTLSLFISTIIGDTEYIEPVTDIWLFVGNDAAFVDVVKDKIETRLEGTS